MAAHHIVLADNLADNSTFVLEDLSIYGLNTRRHSDRWCQPPNLDLTVDSCRFENNFAYAGGGLLINETTINIFDSQFIGNGSVQGGAVYTSTRHSPSTPQSLKPTKPTKALQLTQTLLSLH